MVVLLAAPMAGVEVVSWCTMVGYVVSQWRGKRHLRSPPMRARVTEEVAQNLMMAHLALCCFQSSKRLRQGSGLLPPKLQRRGLVF